MSTLFSPKNQSGLNSMNTNLHLRMGIAAACVGGLATGAVAQTTYTYNGTSWSPSAPVLAAANSVSVTAGTVAWNKLEVLDATTNVVDYDDTPVQSFTAPLGGTLTWVSAFASASLAPGIAVTLNIYSGNAYPPLPANLLASTAFTTRGGGTEERVELTSPLALTAGGVYSLEWVASAGTAPTGAGWRRTAGGGGPSNVYADGALRYALNGTSNNQDLWFRAGFDYALTNLSIASGAGVTLDGCDLFLSGALANSGTLTLTAAEGRYAQVKVGGAIQGTGQVVQQQYLAGTGYHALASSMATGFGTTTGNASALFAYDAAQGNYVVAPSLTAPGLGYFGKLDTAGGFATSDGAFSVSGTPNTAHTYILGHVPTLAPGGSGSGWNLIGNPYPCGLDWNSVITTNPGQNVNNALYIWDAVDANYHYYVNGILPPATGTSLGTSGVVPPLQSFWVQTTQPNVALSTSMASNGTVTVPAVYHKQNPENLHLTLSQIGIPLMRDWAWVLHQPTATTGFDGKYDAWKLPNGLKKPSLALVDANQYLAVNAMDLSRPQCLDLEVLGSWGENYRIELDQVNVDYPYRVLLEDRLTQSVTELSNSHYDFMNWGWDSEAPRFSLWFTPNVGLGEDDLDSAVSSIPGWISHRQGQWITQSSPLARTFFVYSSSGLLCHQGILRPETDRFDFIAPSGTYLVVLSGSGSVSAHQVLVAR